MKHGPSLFVRLIIYPIVAAILSLVALFVILMASGYDIKVQDGKIITKKTGLIIISTTPGEATVVIDGEKYKEKTPAINFFKLKINRVPLGEHSLKIAKEGYIPWEGVVNVREGLVSWLDYLYLVPLEKEAQPYNLPGTVTQSIISNDKTKILVKCFDKAEKVISIWQLDTDNKNIQKIYEVSANQDSDVKLLSFSYDEARYLFLQTEGKTTSYIVREIKENGNYFNVSSLFDIDIDSIMFSPYTHNELYVLKDRSLYNLNLSNKTLSAIIAKNVYGIYESENGLLIIQNLNDNYGLYKISQSGDKTNIIKALPSSEKYKVSYLENNRSYLIYNSDDNELLRYTNEATNPKLETIGKEILSYQISPKDKNRIGLLSRDSYLIYDIESEEYYTVIENKKINKISWFRGGDNLIYHTDNQLRMVNYDGQYDNLLFEATSKNTCVASPSSNTLYFTSNIADNDIDLFTFSF